MHLLSSFTDAGRQQDRDCVICTTIEQPSTCFVVGMQVWLLRNAKMRCLVLISSVEAVEEGKKNRCQGKHKQSQSTLDIRACHDATES